MRAWALQGDVHEAKRCGGVWGPAQLRLGEGRAVGGVAAAVRRARKRHQYPETLMQDQIIETDTDRRTQCRDNCDNM